MSTAISPLKFSIMNKRTIPYFFIIFFAFSACNNDDPKARAQKIVNEWTGKTIEIPDGIDSYFMTKDSIPPASKAAYKLLVYTDSTGCTSCKLNLAAWKHYMQQADSLLSGKLDFAFYFQPQNEKELNFLIKRDKFERFVFMDREAKLLNLNSFPSEMEYQCFLLDANNKVISIGNPTLNPKIWELYKQIVLENKQGAT